MRSIMDYAGSAQRLTASMVSAPLNASDRIIALRCSTPYGINGFGTF